MNAFVDALHRCDPVFGGAGAMVALGLLLAALVLLPKEERHHVRAPMLGVLSFLALAALDAWAPTQLPGQRFVRLIALLLLLLAMGRSAFLLFAYGVWVRRWARPLPQILRDVIQALVYVAVGLLVLRAAGVEPGSLLTTSALLTAVIGLSLQDTLGNLFAGLAIQAQRPFEVGDWIRFDTPDSTVGRVTEINWRATRLLTLAHVEITVPNGLAAKSQILNYSRPVALVRQDIPIVLPLDVSPERARRLVLHALEHTPHVLSEPPAFIVCRDSNERGMVYEVRYFIERFDRHELIESEVRERIWYALRRNGYQVPVPGRRVEMVELRSAAQADTQAEQDRFELLSRLELFSGLDEAELRELARHCRRQIYAPRERIVRQGEEGSDMYVIEHGNVRIEAQVPGAGPRLVTNLERGQVFGEMSLLTGESRAADVVAESETSVLVLDRDSIAPMIEANPVLAEKLSLVLIERRERLLDAHGAPSEPGSVDRVSHHDELLGKIRRFFGLR